MWRISIPEELVNRFVLLFALLAAGAASAQTPSPLMDWQYSTGEVLTTTPEVLRSLDEPLPDWRRAVGPGIGMQPTFMGAKRYHPTPSAIFDFRYKDQFFISDGEGIGYNVLTAPGFRAGLAISYDLGRNTHDDPRIRHLPNISFAPEPKMFAQYFLMPVVLTADLRKAIGGNDGIVGDIGAYIPLPLDGDNKWILFFGPSLTLADRQYMNAYFGVSPYSSRLSGLRASQANGGFASVGGGASSVYLIDDHWLLEGDLAYRRFLGDAARSPIIETKIQLAVDFNIGYRF